MGNMYNYSFVRKLFNKKTFVKLESGEWIDYKSYKNGKVVKVNGNYSTLIWCNCKNILTHTNSFVKQHVLEHCDVWEYKCTSCGKVSYFNPSISALPIPCDKNGIPL